MCNSFNYPPFELDLNAQICQLHYEWNEFIKQHDESLAELYVSDGFYPFYTKQNKKILFIAKEARGLSGENYIETIFNAYHQGVIDNHALNTSHNAFHSIMLYVAWGLLHNCPDFNNIPEDIDIAKEFATETGISFAFMNLSKFSNETEWDADLTLINKFLEISDQYRIEYECNLIAKEISILKPDLIISMLHAKDFQDKYRYIGDLSCKREFKELDLYKLETDFGKYNLIDVYHFSHVFHKPKVPGKEICEKYKVYFYDPIMEAFQSL